MEDEFLLSIFAAFCVGSRLVRTRKTPDVQEIPSGKFVIILSILDLSSDDNENVT